MTWIQNCGSGTHFHPTLKNCVWPSQSGCTNCVVPVESCSDGNHGCDAVSQICVNESDGTSCECKSGFISGFGGVCSDDDECDNIFMCSSGFDCVNTPGSYECVAITTAPPTISTTETPVETCADGIHGCDSTSQVCIDVHDGTDCECKEGFVFGFGGVCNDYNECDNVFKCSSGFDCVNTLGSYECIATTTTTSSVARVRVVKIVQVKVKKIKINKLTRS